MKGLEFLYGLYTPFGSKLAKAYWWAFSNLAFVRICNKVMDANAEFPYDNIMDLCPKGSIMSFNMGTPGSEQKISMLGLAPDGTHFFAKLSKTPASLALSRNEIKILTAFKGMGITPELLDYRIENDYVFFRTSCLDGKNPTNLQLNDDIVNMAITISQKHLSDDSSPEGLLMGLSHGDFTPWNVMISNGLYRMIDWEMADERELGYDLFTYITHVNALFTPDIQVISTIKANKQYLNTYFNAFGITDWTPYMKAFAKRRITYDRSKGCLEHASKFESLL